MGVHRPKRVTAQGPVDALYTDDLLAIYVIQYDEDTMENLGVAMVALLSALPENRLWNKPVIYRGPDGNSISVEGIKRKVYDESKV